MIFKVSKVTFAEGEEEDFDLLALGKQLDEVELEGHRVDAVLQGGAFSCGHSQLRASV